jgi:hypothetical protein
MRLSGRSARSRNRVGAHACDSTLRGRSSSSSPRSSPPSRVKNVLAPRLSLDDDPTNDERHFHISSRYIKFDLITLPSSVPFLKKSGYFNARRYPPLRRYGSRHAPPCLFREGNLIFLCEADTVTGEVREAILSEMIKREPRVTTVLQQAAILSPPIVKRGCVTCSRRIM